MARFEIDEALAAVRLTTKVAWADEPAAALAGPMEQVQELHRMADATTIRQLRAFTTKNEYRAEGHTSPVGWLQHHCRTSKREARRLCHLERKLRTMPLAEEALADGLIGLEHVAVLAEANTPRMAEAYAEAEPLLVEAATDRRFEDFARAVRYFIAQCRPEDEDERARRQADGRQLFLSPSFEGIGFMNGVSDPLSFAEIEGEIRRVERELFATEWAEAKERLGRDPIPADLERTAPQRLHDALREVCRRSNAYAGGAVAASYDVVLHMDWPTWCAEMAVWEGLGDVDYPAARVCETADGTVVAPSTVLSAALAGHVRRIVFGADDEILSFGRSRRLFSGPQHRAGLAKYRGCTHPYGCDRTGPSLQMDHDHEWEDGGETDIVNGKPKCDHHNRWKTNHKAQQRRGPPT